MKVQTQFIVISLQAITVLRQEDPLHQVQQVLLQVQAHLQAQAHLQVAHLQAQVAHRVHLQAARLQVPLVRLLHRAQALLLVLPQIQATQENL